MMDKRTKFTHIGRHSDGVTSGVNPDIRRTTTVIIDKAENLYRNDLRIYGRHGSTVQDGLEDAFTALEDGAGTVLTSSGLSACTLSIMSAVKTGDHILITDSIYGPSLNFCQTFLKSMGIETERYNPRIGADIKTLIRPNTSLIALEAPGSLTFEIQDVPAIAKVAQEHRVTTMIDNTWSGGLTYNPLKFGVDMSVHAATKYVGGHSDVFGGAIISRTKNVHEKVKKTRKNLGLHLSPDSAYELLRGFRTLIPRFQTQEATALELAKWLDGQDWVKQVLHPALLSHPDHDIWARDFTGAACLFGVVLNEFSEDQVMKFIDGLNHFGIGFSYGGFESVVIHCDTQLNRKFDPGLGGPLIRLGCGMEALEDLKNDIKQSVNATL